MNRARLALTAALLCAGAIAVAKFTHGASSSDGQPDGPPRDTSSAVPPPRSAAVEQALASERWQPGQTTTYHLEANRTVTMGDDPLDSRLGLEGQWHVTVVDVTPDLVALRVQLEGPSLTFADHQRAKNQDEIRALERAMAEPMYMALRPDGLLERAFLPKGTDPFAKAMLLSVAATAQLVIPHNHGAAWTAAEHDPTGQYEATYQVHGGAEIHKTKSRYLQLASDNGWVTPAPQDGMSMDAATVFVRANGVVQSIVSQEKFTMRLSPNAPPVQSLAHLELSLVSTSLSDRQSSFADSIAGLEAVAFDGTFDAVAVQHDEDLRLIDGASFDELMSALRQALAQTDHGAQSHLMVRLGAFFRQHPEAVERAVDEISAGLAADAAGPVIGALGDAGTDAAQAGLAALALDGDVGTQPRLQSIASLGLVADPNGSSVDTLGGLIGDDDAEISSSALLALGAAGRGRHEDRVVDDLLERWSQARTPAEQVLILEALGNTGSDKALGAVEQAIASSVASVRGAGYGALRFIKHPSVDTWLTAGLFGDPVAQVRRDILFAIGFRVVREYLPSLDRLLRSESQVAVRLDAVALLGPHAVDFDGALSLLVAVAASDADQEVREAARRYVEAARQSRALRG